MLQLDNATPFAATILGLPDLQGVDTLFVVVQGTFRTAPKLIVDDVQALTLVDEYWGEPGTSSLKVPGEAHLGKRGTDVFVIGQACAPQERPVPYVDVGLAIAGRVKMARVFGDRHWTEGIQGICPSPPRPFIRLPVVYEHAYGGRNELRNPVGRGMLGPQRPQDLLGHPVPNIEDPKDPLRFLGAPHAPVGFGPVAPTWHPRQLYAGTYDDAWTQTRAPYLPTDFDARFFNAASPDLVFATPLEGGEEVSFLNFHPGGKQTVRLPRCALRATASVSGKVESSTMVLETIALEPTVERMRMTWRGRFPVDKNVLKVERVRVGIDQLELGS